MRSISIVPSTVRSGTAPFGSSADSFTSTVRLSGNNYDNGLYVAAVILLASAVLMAFMPKYRFGVGHVAAPVAGSPATQTA